MWWVTGWAVVTATGIVGLVASVNSARFDRDVGAEARALTAGAHAPPSIDMRRLASMPAPVGRYLDTALAGVTRPIRTVHLRHGGRFRPSLDGTWLPISGEQFFRADPPAFIWRGRVRMAPGLWVDARDRSVDGAGNMFVSAESTITLANSSGPELDQGALLRLLGEMVWLPTAWLDDRYVRWSAVDDHRARATLQVNGRTVSGDFVFGADGLPSEYRAERYRDTGGGHAVLTPFVGRCAEYRRVNGVLVPFRMIGAWEVDGKTMEYADFEVKTLDPAP